MMKIGIPKEIKNHEYRVALTPAGAAALVREGHQVTVEAGAGLGAGFDDTAYQHAGAMVASKVEEVFDHAELIVKVKEPQPIECERLRQDQILFAYLHLAADKAQASALCQAGVTAIAYETITDHAGRLPLLLPMSEVAGRLAAQAAAMALTRPQHGRGVLMGGLPGVPPARVAVLGGGVVGENAIAMALGLGAQVTVLDISADRLRVLANQFGPSLQTRLAHRENVLAELPHLDVVIGAVLIPGASAPKLILKSDLELLKKGSVLVDVAIDQGGCFETSRPTTHEAPTYIEAGIVHYCVANMPGAVPVTSTLGLTNATLPYIQRLARGGIAAVKQDPHFALGINIEDGKVVHPAVAASLG